VRGGDYRDLLEMRKEPSEILTRLLTSTQASKNTTTTLIKICAQNRDTKLEA
jgi:hypothetical protein